MKTSQPSAADTAHNITEEAVTAFLVSKTEELAAAVGDQYCTLTLEVTRHPGSKDEATGTAFPAHFTVRASSYVHGGDIQSASTMAAAIELAVIAMAPGHRAAKLREQAAALLAKADKLSTGGAAL